MLETRRESPGRAGVITSGLFANASEPGAPFSHSGTESPCAANADAAQREKRTKFLIICAPARIRGLNQKTRNLNPGPHALQYGNPAFRDRKAARAIALRVEPDRISRRHVHVLIENRALHLRVSPDIHVVEQDAVFHIRPGMN